MTEKLLTGTLSLNTNKQMCKFEVNIFKVRFSNDFFFATNLIWDDYVKWGPYAKQAIIK